MTKRHAQVLGLGAAAIVACAASAAEASESGTSVYLLGSGGPGAALLPPVQGVFFVNTFYHYEGEAGGDRQFPIGGNVVAGLKGQVDADFPTILWVPTTDFAGGVLAVGGVLPVGVPSVDISAVITGPLGGQASVSRGEDKLIVGDPLLTAALAWKRGQATIQANTLINIPIGDYRADHLANLAFHRWAVDTSVAVTWRDAANSWDLSAKTGLTFNGENPSTDYETGTEWHIEGSVEKIFSPAFSAGIQAYHFDQVSGDSGPGARLGDFKGRVTGVGLTGAYNFKIGERPATLRLHAVTEFGAKNRLEGDAIWLDFSLPISMKLPSGS